MSILRVESRLKPHTQYVPEVDLSVRSVDRDDPARFRYDVGDGKIVTRHGTVLAATLHQQVEINEGADVAALPEWKPEGVGGSGYGSTTSEAYRIPGTVAVIPIYKAMRIATRHEMASFQRLENRGHDLVDAVARANCISVLDLFGLSGTGRV